MKFVGMAIAVILVAAVAVSYFADQAHFSTDASAEAAIAVAILTAFLLLANYDLVAATQKLAAASAAQTAVLATSAEPELTARWKPQGVGPMRSEITYVSGSLPARQINVHGRHAGLLYTGTTKSLMASEGSCEIVMQQVTVAQAQNWPFALRADNLAPNQNWIGLTWRGLVDADHTVRWKDEPVDGHVAFN